MIDVRNNLYYCTIRSGGPDWHESSDCGWREELKVLTSIDPERGW